MDAQVLDYLKELQQTVTEERQTLAAHSQEESGNTLQQNLRPGETLMQLRRVSTEANCPHESSLQDLSLDFSAGQVVGIAGRPGCGVITIFDLLAGWKARLTRGDIVRSNSTLRSVGVIPADGRSEGSIDELTVAENLALRQRKLLGWRGWIGGRLRAFAQNLVDRFDIQPPSQNMMAGQLSGGNRQKMILARELTHAKDLLLAMNPTSGLDIIATRFVRQALKDKAREGCCVVVYSEDLDELAALADVVHVLSRGRLVVSLISPEISPEQIGKALTELDEMNPTKLQTPARELFTAAATPQESK